MPLTLALPDLTNSSLEPGLRPHLIDLSADLALGGERKVGRVPLADSQAGYQQVAALTSHNSVRLVVDE